MPGYRNIGGTWRPIVPWRNIAGTWRSGILWRNIAGVWKVVAGTLTVALAPSPAIGSSPSAPVTAACTATVFQGSGSYTYSWNAFPDTGGSVTLANATTATVTISSGAIAFGGIKTGTLTCTVTDTGTGQTRSVSTSYYLERT